MIAQFRLFIELITLKGLLRIASVITLAVSGIFGIILLLLLLTSIRFIPNNRVGIIEKRFSSKGSVKEGFIALSHEAGYQPEILRGGLRLLMPLQFRVHLAPL